MQAGQKVTLPVAPIELVSLRYRLRFHLSPAQMSEVPMQVMLRDLKILELEADARRQVAEALKEGDTIS